MAALSTLWRTIEGQSPRHAASRSHALQSLGNAHRRRHVASRWVPSRRHRQRSDRRRVVSRLCGAGLGARRCRATWSCSMTGQLAFAKLKALPRTARPRTFDHVCELVAIALALFTPTECRNFIHRCGDRVSGVMKTARTPALSSSTPTPATAVRTGAIFVRWITELAVPSRDRPADEIAAPATGAAVSAYAARRPRHIRAPGLLLRSHGPFSRGEHRCASTKERARRNPGRRA